MMFDCAACKSKDSEIEFLREQLKTVTEAMTNMLDPMLQARLAASKREPQPQKEPTPMTPRNPAMLRGVKRDRPSEAIVQEEAERARLAQELEDKFSAGDTRQP